MLDFDVLMNALGKLGRAQTLMYLMLCYYMLFAGFNSLATVFIAYLPEYRYISTSSANHLKIYCHSHNLVE